MPSNAAMERIPAGRGFAHAGVPAPAERPPADRAETLARLRERVARIEGIALHRLDAPDRARPEDQGDQAATRKTRNPVRSLGVADVDTALGGGFPAEGLTEIHVEETRGSGTGAGFALSLAVVFGASQGRPLLWAGSRHAFSEAGMPYRPGLLGHGLDPAALLLVRTRTLEQSLWVGEEAARSGAPALVILEVRGNPGLLSLEGTRRLHVRARESGIPVLLLRQAGRPDATAAPMRLRISAAPAASVPGLDHEARLIGHPVFRLAVEKSRGGRPHDLLLEWNPHECRFRTPSSARRAEHAEREAPGRTLPLHGDLPPAPVDGPDPARAPRPLLALRRTG